MIQKTIKWRREWVPEEIRYDSLPLQMARGKVMVPRGNILDKFGRPIVYMEGRRDTPEAQKEGARPMIEHLVYWLEVACRQADASPEVCPRTHSHLWHALTHSCHSVGHHCATLSHDIKLMPDGRRSFACRPMVRWCG